MRSLLDDKIIKRKLLRARHEIISDAIQELNSLIIITLAIAHSRARLRLTQLITKVRKAVKGSS